MPRLRPARLVASLRAVREQLVARTKVLKTTDSAEALVKDANALVARLDALESKLHNPEARVNYAILAGRSGGVKLHSRLSPPYTWSHEGDGAPTEPMREIYARLEKELEALEADWTAVLEKDLPALNAKARARAPEERRA
jgi:crotonobetainyl-CoA:carnitine CoA-transferase CaiB-like acyl-CoA transferase